MIEKSKIVNVLNYNENPVCIKTHVKEYLCPAMEGSNPSITPLDYSEVESLNSNSPVFKIGSLFFEEDMQEEVYEALKILNWKDILRNEYIQEILLHPTLEGLVKIVDIKSVMLFERVRGIFFTLKNSNQHDLSTRVEKIITARYKELCHKKLKTQIILTAKDTISSVSAEEVGDLKRQNELLQKQMLDMKNMMQEMMVLQQNVNTTANETAVVSQTNDIPEMDSEQLSKKKAGRPKKT